MKNKRPYDLSGIFLETFVGWLKSIFIKKKDSQFPAHVGNFKFLRKLEKIGPRKSYSLALYQNTIGKKAIAKMKSSQIKGYHYYSLLNEIALFEILNSTVERIGNKMPNNFKDIYIPKLIDTYEDEKILVSLVEFVEGNVTENFSPEKKINLYFKMVDFLQYIGEKFTLAEKAKISQRTAGHYLFLYPFLVVKAMVTYPESIPYVLQGVSKFIPRIPVIIKESKLSLVHRDLHFMNIIKMKNMFALVDFQQTVFTEPLHELITTLRYWWKVDRIEEFGQLLMRQIVRRYSSRKNFRELFQAYTINSVTHGLTGAGFSQKIISGWIDFLKFGLNPHFEKYQ